MSHTTHSNRALFVGIAAGIGGGLLLAAFPGDHALRTAVLWLVGLVGGMFVAALKMIMVPLLFASVASGVRSLWQHDGAGRVGAVALGFFAATAAIAVITGLLATNVFQPGAGLGSELLAGVFATNDTSSPQLSPDSLVRSLLVDSLQNPFAALAQAAILPLLVSAVLVGVACGRNPQALPTLGRLVDELLALSLMVVGWIMRLAPLGIAALLAGLVESADGALFGALALFAGVVIGSTLLHGLMTLPLLVWWLGGRSPWAFLSSIRVPMVTALATSSSAATLPVSLRCADHDLRVAPGVSRFVLPLGTTINMDGTALYEAAAALFIAQLVGIELSLAQQILVALLAMLAAIGAPGIPSAGMVTMAVVLQAVGLPVEAVALLLPIDRLLDAVRTAVNVEGDLATAVVTERLALRRMQD